METKISIFDLVKDQELQNYNYNKKLKAKITQRNLLISQVKTKISNSIDKIPDVSAYKYETTNEKLRKEEQKLFKNLLKNIDILAETFKMEK